MEDVLDVYERPYDPRFPMIAMDEASKQLIKEIRKPIDMQPGKPQRYDSEYERNGVCNMFMFFEPLQGKRYVTVTDRRTKKDWANCIKTLVDVHYPNAQKIVLVMDNLNTHTPASLYETFPPAEAKRITDKLEIHHTPKHGSWLNVAEIELSVLSRQCLDRRIETKENLIEEVDAWQTQRNSAKTKLIWRFTKNDARVKLKKLYPTLTCQ